MLAVPLTYAVAQPWAVVVVGADTLLAHPAVPGSKRHVDEALGAEPQADLDLAGLLTPLNGR